MRDANDELNISNVALEREEGLWALSNQSSVNRNTECLIARMLEVPPCEWSVQCSVSAEVESVLRIQNGQSFDREEAACTGEIENIGCWPECLIGLCNHLTGPVLDPESRKIVLAKVVVAAVELHGCIIAHQKLLDDDQAKL